MLTGRMWRMRRGAVRANKADIRASVVGNRGTLGRSWTLRSRTCSRIASLKIEMERRVLHVAW